MIGDAKFQPREEWPAWVVEPLDRVGITRYETVATIMPKIKALGFEVLTMSEDRGGILQLGPPLYYAAVIDPNDVDSIRGEYWSETDYAEALAWATAGVLKDKERRAKLREQHLASGEPDEYALPDFGPGIPDEGVFGFKFPEGVEGKEFAAHILVGNEVVGRVSTPLRRITASWDEAAEKGFLAAVRHLARECDLRGHKGEIRLVMNPGTAEEFEESVSRQEN